MAGKVKQNDFQVNIEESVNEIFGMLNEAQYEPLLKELIRKEVIKKQDEIQKNYSNLERFIPGTFCSKVYERLIKRVWFPNTRNAAAPVSLVQPAADESSNEEAPVAVAAKSTKASSKKSK